MRQNVETMLGCFAQIRRVYANEINKRFQKEAFSPNEINILLLLSNNPSISTGSEIKVLLGVSKGLVSRSMDSLRNRNLIILEQDQKDKRIQRIKLTEEAEKLVIRMKREIREIDEELLRGISEKEILQMEQTMNKILERFREKEENNENENVKRS